MSGKLRLTLLSSFSYLDTCTQTQTQAGSDMSQRPRPNARTKRAKTDLFFEVVIVFARRQNAQRIHRLDGVLEAVRSGVIQVEELRQLQQRRQRRNRSSHLRTLQQCNKTHHT